MAIEVTKLPFSKMTFSPDIPTAALGPNEYNSGANIETDVRGIRSVAGDMPILDTIPGTPTFVTAGFRQGGQFWFVVATTEGHWWASNGPSSQGHTTWYDITPQGVGDFTKYTQSTNFTAVWNGTVLILNDETNPPMFWPDTQSSVLVMYSNQQPLTITTISNTTLTTRTIGWAETTNYYPFQVGSYITVAGVDPRYYDGNFLVTNCTTSTVTYSDNTIGPYSAGGTVSPQYTWNYNPNWSAVYAKFLRMYNTPNVGSILVAGNLVATSAINSSTQLYPVTVQWSQSFGLNQVPTTWTPTITNVANQLEVPLRGPAIDGFNLGGQFFLCSYWDTVVFSPINYSTTSAPILGVNLFTQGRGLLSSNCWAATDTVVYGVDARDIWVFNGQTFTGLGNQRVKNYFYDQLDPAHYDRVYVQINTQKNQVEIYYPTSSAVNGVPNKMISYRFDIDCWNPPRDVDSATFSCESPLWVNGNPKLGLRTVAYARGVTNSKIVEKDQGFYFVQAANSDVPAPINSQFRRDNIKILPNYTSKVMVHRVLPEVNNIGSYINQGNELQLTTSTGGINVLVEGANSVGSTASSAINILLSVDANGNPGQNPWAQVNQNTAYRVNTLALSTASTSTIWLCSAVTMQVAAVEEDR